MVEKSIRRPIGDRAAEYGGAAQRSTGLHQNVKRTLRGF